MQWEAFKGCGQGVGLRGSSMMSAPYSLCSAKRLADIGPSSVVASYVEFSSGAEKVVHTPLDHFVVDIIM